MHIAMFYHSLLSDWNHGNAHFLRGLVTELLSRGHKVQVYEPANGWSLKNLLAEHGAWPVHAFKKAYRGLTSLAYTLETLDLDEALNAADLVLVHEWNEPELVRRIGEHHNKHGRYRLLFHDTHHRAVTHPASMVPESFTHYDGALAFGNVLRALYLEQGWAKRAWTWHEAADTRVFHPLNGNGHWHGNGHYRIMSGDVVWIGNWGDEERTAELREFFLEPVKALGIAACAYGVRYPNYALEELAKSNIAYGRWLPNYEVPHAFHNFNVTIHVPRRPYVEALPGIPTIRPFEALACGIPLICSPWEDAEGLFTPGKDYLVARTGDEMTTNLEILLKNRPFAEQIARHGRRTIWQRHTCAHRVNELLKIYQELIAPAPVRGVELPHASGLREAVPFREGAPLPKVETFTGGAYDRV
jgi:spore maturation protein CgeB